MKIELNMISLAERFIKAVEEMGFNNRGPTSPPGCLEKIAIEAEAIAAAGHDIADAIRELAQAVRSDVHEISNQKPDADPNR